MCINHFLKDRVTTLTSFITPYHLWPTIQASLPFLNLKDLFFKYLMTTHQPVLRELGDFKDNPAFPPNPLQSHKQKSSDSFLDLVKHSINHMVFSVSPPTEAMFGNQDTRVSLEIDAWIFVGRTDAEAPILWPPDVKSWLIGKDPDAGKDWGQEEKGTTEDEMVGWHHWLNGREFKQTLGDSGGQGSLARCSPWGCKELYTT